MRLGDVLEWLAAGALVAAGYLWKHSIPLALVIAAVGLAYFGQCYGAQKLSIPKFWTRKQIDS